MRVRSRGILGVSVILLSGMMAFPLGAQTPSASDSTNQAIRIPRHIATFDFAGRHDFDDPKDGVQLRYTHPDSVYVDLFIYPGPDFGADCNLECASDVIKREVDGFREAFPRMIAEQYVDTIWVSRDETLTPTASTPWRLGRHLTLGERIEGHAMQSEYYLYYMPHYRVKVRATYESARPSAAAAIDAFVAALFPALLAPATPQDQQHQQDTTAAAKNGATPIAVSVTLPDSIPVVARKLVAALVASGYTIADSSVARGVIVTAPNFAWPKGMPLDTASGAESPGVIVRIQLKPAEKTTDHTAQAGASGGTAVTIAVDAPVRVRTSNDVAIAQQLKIVTVITLSAALEGKTGH